MDGKRQVELVPAYCWQCQCCETLNFVEAEFIGVMDGAEHDPNDHSGMYIPTCDGQGVFVVAPTRVKCVKCGIDLDSRCVDFCDGDGGD
mgnify:CR=1 FL=1